MKTVPLYAWAQFFLGLPNKLHGSISQFHGSNPFAAVLSNYEIDLFKRQKE